MDALFCPQCRSILDIPADEDFIICSVCGEKQAASGTTKFRSLNSLAYPRRFVFF
jgi:DNA-directed RNA polymerase subunit M/transcription elongation factor TFIIS